MSVDEGTTFLYSVEDCKIYELLTDSGESPTYDDALDVPGIRSVTARFNTEEKEWRGDSRTIDRRNTIKDVELSVEHAMISHDVQAIVIGGTSALTGVTPEQISSWKLVAGDAPKFFKIAFRVVEVDGEGADFQFTAYKCKLSGNPELGAQQDDYKACSFSCKAIPCNSDDSWIDQDLNETGAPLS